MSSEQKKKQAKTDKAGLCTGVIHPGPRITIEPSTRNIISRSGRLKNVYHSIWKDFFCCSAQRSLLARLSLFSAERKGPEKKKHKISAISRYSNTESENETTRKKEDKTREWREGKILRKQKSTSRTKRQEGRKRLEKSQKAPRTSILLASKRTFYTTLLCAERRLLGSGGRVRGFLMWIRIVWLGSGYG